MSENFPVQPAGTEADVVMLLEGTHPYVSGGVSSWVHQILRGLPELTFSIVFLGSTRDTYGKMKYQLPKNLIHLETHFIMESWRQERPRACPGNAHAFENARQLHDFFRVPSDETPDELFAKVMESLGSKRGISRQDFLNSEQSWRPIRED